MTILDTTFDEHEADFLRAFLSKFEGEIKVFYAIDEKKLFHESFTEGESRLIQIDAPRRMIEIGGLYLLEEKGWLGMWNMGDLNKEGKYVFWGGYGALGDAVQSL
jgi:hypothetical protein